MSRPLTGRIERTATGWRASLPSSHGSRSRTKHTFASHAAARSWLAAAISAHEAGQPLPDPDPVKLARSARRGVAATIAVVTFGALFTAWWTERFVRLGRADAGRAVDVRKRLERLQAYFDSAGLTPESLTREDYLQVLEQWSGRRQGPLNRRLTQAEAAAGASHPGYSPAVLKDLRDILDAALGHAKTLGVTLQFDPSTVATPTTLRAPAPRRAPLTLDQARQIAAHLHVVHQLVLWLLRVLGLRISEAYGLTVDAIVYLDPTQTRMALMVAEMGGKPFHRRDDKGRFAIVRHVEGTKTVQSVRLLPVPPSLATLIEAVVRIIHTGPEGSVDRGARLIPHLRKADTGQGGFRAALNAAALRCGVTTLDVDALESGSYSAVVPHDGRRGLITEMTWQQADERALKRFAGHAAGTEVHNAAYVLDHPMGQHLRELCQQIEETISAALPSGLMVPTHLRCTTGQQPLLAPRAAQIDAALLEIGWLTGTDEGGDPVLDTAGFARVLGIRPTTARRWLREHGLPTFPLPGGRADQRGIRLSDALAYREQRTTKTAIAALAAELGRTPADLHGVINRQQMPYEVHGNVAWVPADTEAAIRAWHETHVQQERDGFTVAATAAELGLAATDIDGLIKAGALDLLPRHGPARYVSRASVARVREQMSSSPVRRRMAG